MSDNAGVMRAADGKPLKQSLNEALFQSRRRAFVLVLPLLLFIFLMFIVPIAYLLFQAVYNPTFSSSMPRTTSMLAAWDGQSEPTEEMFAVLVEELALAREERTIGQVATHINRVLSGTRSLFTRSARSAARLEAPFKEALIDVDDDWGELETWQAMKVGSSAFTTRFLANALDMQVQADGSYAAQDEVRRIHITLFLRTLEISTLVTLMTILLGYPVAYLLSSLPNRSANMLLILVLLPFWTSILVRTTAWIAMLQGEGVINDLLVTVGVTSDNQRFSLIYNKTGTLIAMTHILLPFMILPLYSVMKTIPISYMRAARSLGATDWTAFWRVYFPQTVPGIGAGGILVFILAIGYYITPALLGGSDGVMISNIIDDHMRSSLNYSLAAALGLVLLVFVLMLYWLYDRIVGIDNMKLG